MEEWAEFEERFWEAVRLAVYSQTFHETDEEPKDAKSKKRRAMTNRERMDKQFAFLQAYFKKNWFVKPWIREC